MKQTSDKPVSNFSVPETKYTITATGASGVITTGEDPSALTLGQSVYLKFDSTPTHGFSELTEYFVIPIDTNSFAVASTYANALAGTEITTTGDDGAGDVYPIYKVGGTLFVGTGGDIYVRGVAIQTNGFTLLKNLGDGISLPYMIKDVCMYNTTATDLVAWIG